MNAERASDITQEPLDGDERILMDPQTWDWETDIEVKVGTNPGAVLSARFSKDEILAIAHVAERHGMNAAAFMRHTLLEAVAADSAPSRRISS